MCAHSWFTVTVDDQMNAQMFYFTDSSKKDQRGVINLMEISSIVDVTFEDIERESLLDSQSNKSSVKNHRQYFIFCLVILSLCTLHSNCENDDIFLQRR